jgi:polysaccharide deacetylase family protein (PEP-CTERM system associated)
VPQSIFSIDVEDWFNLSGTGCEPPPSQWDRLESRVERNFRGLLALLAEGGSKATCFFLGYFAKRFPQLVREAVAAGHEIASHSYFHRLVYEQSPTEFYADARDTRMLLEDICGQPVRGFRAPAFSVTAQTPWFFDKLAEAGYRYDSSVFPAPHQTGGLATGRLGPHRVDTACGPLAEFPITAVRVLGRPTCFFGGGYLRLFPYPLIRSMGRRALNDGRPAVFYVHPREIDPEQPRLPLSARRKFTCYVNLRSTRPKIQHILRDFKVTSFADYLSQGRILQ